MRDKRPSFYLRLFFLCYLVLNSGILPLHSQEEADPYADIRIGIAILEPISNIYSWFGHAGIAVDGDRAQLGQALQGLDSYYDGQPLFFDYGNFSFAEEHFLKNFFEGKLTFIKGVSNLNSVIRSTLERENRGTIIYWLNLNSAQKAKFLAILQSEVSRENRFYRYDYYFDNCLTRIRDQLNEVLDYRLAESYQQKSSESLRQLLFRALEKRFFGLLGVDYLQGALIDQNFSKWQSIVFPEHLMPVLEQAVLPGTDQPLVSSKSVLKAFQVQRAPLLPKRYLPIVLAIFFAALIAVQKKLRKNYPKSALGQRPARRILSLSFELLRVISALVIGLLSLALYLFNYFHSYPVALNNANLLLGTPLLLLQIPLSLGLLTFSLAKHEQGKRALLRLQNFLWTGHFILALLAPLFAFTSSLLRGQNMQNLWLAWLCFLPIFYIFANQTAWIKAQNMLRYFVHKVKIFR